MTVTVRGGDEVADTLVRAAKDLGDLRPAHDQASRLMAAAVRAPRDTGRLAASVAPHPAADRAAVGAGVRYAAAVEYGSARRGIPGQFFLRRAVESTQAQWMDVYTAEVTQICGRVRGV